MGANSPSPHINRRSALKLGSSMPVLAALHPGLLADGDGPPGMRSPDTAGAQRVVDPPPLPPLEVLALSRLAYGYSPSARAEIDSLGSTPAARFAAFVEQQLNPDLIDDTACLNRLNAFGFSTLGKSLAQLWSDHVVNNNQGYSYRVLPLEETRQATVLRAVYSRRQLFELLVDFWHNHFNVYGEHYYVAPAFVHYDRDVIRANALGNFRLLLGGVATSTAMLYYLDNYISKAGGFNENFARELLELHTLGVDSYYGTGNPFDVPLDENGVPLGYVDNDVYEAARAFTGWRVDYGYEEGVGDSGTFLYYDAWHDRANKFFMRQYLPADQPEMQDGRDVLDAIAVHNGTARHIARKLCVRFVSDMPSETLIDQAAQTFLDNHDAPDQLRRVLRTILLSDEFQATWGEKIKRPFEAAVGMLRATQAEFSPSNEFFWDLERMSQLLFNRFSPDGYPDRKSAWSSTNSMLQRWREANRMIEGWVDGVTIDVFAQTPANVRSPNALADYWINRILGRSMHPAENRAEIVEFLAQGRNPDFDLPQEEFTTRLPRMVAILLMSPDFQLR